MRVLLVVAIAVASLGSVVLGAVLMNQAHEGPGGGAAVVRDAAGRLSVHLVSCPQERVTEVRVLDPSTGPPTVLGHVERLPDQGARVVLPIADHPVGYEQPQPLLTLPEDHPLRFEIWGSLDVQAVIQVRPADLAPGFFLEDGAKVARPLSALPARAAARASCP